MNLEQQFAAQRFANGYQLVNGVEMHAEHGDRFQIPHDVLKKYVGVGHFVEIRIDSPRFSVHEGSAENCTCPSCNGIATKPILSHPHPASLVSLPLQDVPARGWGEDFWAHIIEREGDFIKAVVDNALCETRLHELRQGDQLVFHSDHMLAVHGIHRLEIVSQMRPAELKTLARWLGEQK